MPPGRRRTGATARGSGPSRRAATDQSSSAAAASTQTPSGSEPQGQSEAQVNGSTEQDASSSLLASKQPQTSRSTSLREAPTSSPAPSTRARPVLKVQPKNIQRRSQAEREAAANAEAERLRSRVVAAEAVPKREDYRGRHGERGHGRSRGGGRGGFMGDTVASGPFGSGVVSGHKVGSGPPRTRIPGSSTGASVAGEGNRVKRVVKVQVDSEGDARMLDAGIVKKEDNLGGYISSDPDEDIEGPRVDVANLINLVSSEEEDSDDGNIVKKGKRPDRARLKSAHDLAPVRVSRREHVDRSMGMGAAAELGASEWGKKERADASHQTSSVAAQGFATRKGKLRGSDVEYVRDERKWKGVYDDEKDESERVRIKEEPSDGDDEPITVPPHLGTPERGSEQHPAIKDPPSSPMTLKKSKRRSSGKDAKPVLQTAHEREEWARRQAELEIIRDELGRVNLGPAADDDDAEDRTSDNKADAVYLFQFPPVLPDLRPASDAVKKEAKSPVLTATATALDHDHDLPRPNEPAMNEPVKVEDDDDDDVAVTKSRSLGPSLTAGLAGKLRVHASGRATLSWGGTGLELNMGTAASFLQDTVLVKVTPEAERVRAEDGGEAMAFGQIRGKFVVTPDWNSLFG